MGRLRDAVWAINRDKDSIEELKFRMMDFKEEINSNQRIDINFKAHIGDGKRLFTPTIRQAAYLIFKESFVNIMKHSDASNVDSLLKWTMKN